MTKSELVTKISEKSELTKKETELALKAFISSVEEALSNGEKVQIVGFGTFERRERKEREGRNPKTQEKMIIPASYVPAFKAGKEFKALVNK